MLVEMRFKLHAEEFARKLFGHTSTASCVSRSLSKISECMVSEVQAWLQLNRGQACAGPAHVDFTSLKFPLHKRPARASGADSGASRFLPGSSRAPLTQSSSR